MASDTSGPAVDHATPVDHRTCDLCRRTFATVEDFRIHLRHVRELRRSMGLLMRQDEQSAQADKDTR